MKSVLSAILVCVSTSALANPVVNQLTERREQIRSWVSVCQEAPWQGTFSSTKAHCDHGDLMIFAGLSCVAATLAGDTETAEARCRDIELSQGRNGRWWRGPKFVDTPFEGSSFSRDQFRGIVAYMISYGLLTRDPVKNEKARGAMMSWLKYLEQEKGNNMCDDGKGMLSSCHMRGSTLNLTYLTLSALGLENEAKRMLGEDSRLWRKIHGARADHKSLFNELEILFAEKGYPLHLKASSVLFHRLLGYYQHSSTAKARIRHTVKALERKDPENPLFEFLDKGSSPEVIAKVLKRCPVQAPTGPNEHTDWQWQRDSSEQTWKRSNGWDCIYMLNLLIAHQNKKLTWVW